MTNNHTTGRRIWTSLLTLLVAGALLLTVSPSASAGGRELGELRVLDDRSDRVHDRVVTCDFWIAGLDMPVEEGKLVVKRVSDGEKVIEEEWETNQDDNFITGPHTLPPGTYKAFAFAERENNLHGIEPRKEPVAEPVTFIVEECEPDVLPCPTDLKARALDNGDVFIRFDPAEGSNGSRIYRSTGDQDPVLVAELEGENDTFLDTTTVPGTTYTYMVTGVFEGGEESEDCPTVQVTAIPVFPTVLGALAASTVGVLAYAGLRRRV